MNGIELIRALMGGQQPQRSTSGPFGGAPMLRLPGPLGTLQNGIRGGLNSLLSGFGSERTTGPGMLSNQGGSWQAPGNPGAGWTGGYTAPGTGQQGWGHYSDGTQHGPPSTMAQSGGTPRPARTEGAIHNYDNMRAPNGSWMGGPAGGVNALLRGNTINNGRLLGMGVIPWRQSGITFGSNPEAL